MLTSNKQDKHDWKWRKHIHILIYYSSLFLFPHWSYLWLKIQNPHWPSSKLPPPLQLQISFASNMYFTLRSIETWCRQLLRPLLKEQKKKKNTAFYQVKVIVLSTIQMLIIINQLKLPEFYLHTFWLICCPL